MFTFDIALVISENPLFFLAALLTGLASETSVYIVSLKTGSPPYFELIFSKLTSFPLFIEEVDVPSFYFF